MINMRKYTAKDEEELIKQIESDTGLDSELEQQELVKGHVAEIRYGGKGEGKPTHMLERDRLPFMRDYCSNVSRHQLIQYGEAYDDFSSPSPLIMSRCRSC